MRKIKTRARGGAEPAPTADVRRDAEAAGGPTLARAVELLRSPAAVGAGSEHARLRRSLQRSVAGTGRRLGTIRRAPAAGAAKPAAAPPVEASPVVAEVNESNDFVAAGVAPKGKAAGGGHVELVAPKQHYHAPQGLELKCFLHRDGSAIKFAGKHGAVHLAKEQAQAEFGPLVVQATTLFQAHPAPHAAPKKEAAKPASAAPVHRDAAGAAPAAADGLGQVHEALRDGAGKPLGAATRREMESALGADLGSVRVHDNAAADQASRDLGAHAFAHGQDVYFRAGRYAPDTREGRRLLAHELTHTVQQGPAPAGVARSAAPDELRVSEPGDPLEREAEAVAGRIADGRPAPVEAAPPEARREPMLARDAAPGAGGGAAPAAGGGAAPGGGGEAASLAGDGPFAPPAGIASRIDAAGNAGALVPVRLGGLAAGDIRVRKAGDTYETTDAAQKVPLLHPALEPLRQAKLVPVLAVQIKGGAVSGYATVSLGGTGGPTPEGLVNAIKSHTDALGWTGMDLTRFQPAVNTIEGGVFKLEVPDFAFHLGGFLEGTGHFGLANETVTFQASAAVKVPKLGAAQVKIERGADGVLAAEADVPIELSKFSGNLHVGYHGGVVDAVGEVGYQSEKFSGKVTVLVTDAETARDVAKSKLPPERIKQSAQEAAAAPAGGGAPKAGPRALAGFGELDFHFTEWMTGKGLVIVDNVGHITVSGAITPPAEVELLPQRDYIKRVFTIEARALYGVPLVGNLFVFANIGMDALAKLGPAKLYNIVVTGTYSTDPDVSKEMTISGSLNVSAFAGLRMRAEGGAGVQLLGHDLKAGVGVDGLAGVRGYAEATPTLGYREKSEGDRTGKGEFYLHGHLEIAAQPFLGLGGDLFVELVSPWWSPAPSKKWTWPLGQLDYPLPGQFGIGADIDYAIGSGKLPEVQFGQVDFNADRFMTDLLNDHAAPKKGDQDTKGTFGEGGDKGAGGAKDPKQTDSKGAPPKEPAKGQHKPEDGKPPAPAVEKQWLEGMKALRELAAQTKLKPIHKKALKKELAGIKEKYHFTVLRMKRAGQKWVVHAEMNPKPEDTEFEGGDDKTLGHQISRGHAWKKHAQWFHDVEDQDDLADMIDGIVLNAGAKNKVALARGRTAYWDDDAGVIILEDPQHEDGGTVFRPDEGRAYFDDYRKNPNK